MSTAGAETEGRPSPWLQLTIPVLALAVDGVVALSAPGANAVWYVIRASGIVAYVLLALSVMAGLLISSRSLPAGQGRADAFEIHSFLALLVLGFATVHGLALLLDTYIGFSPSQLLVPFTSSYRPVAVGAGMIGLYLTGIVYVSVWAKRFIGYKAWRALHYASFIAFVLGSLHGIFSGTDTGTVWMTALYAGSIAAVLALLARRILSAGRGKRRVTGAALAVAA
jgi:sulfoxide reductase heme-binding subunit YedZ